ncbi:hypothetical protein BKA65DRAFT_413641 [Rhexocercosporidium sp. MPI-PUGE-AT-0058]|nr:hypothetical protein BKA65DRAFT_413641 [Rhexocercosporidium sp. MPI-PUGE-AT-0058]
MPRSTLGAESNSCGRVTQPQQKCRECSLVLIQSACEADVRHHASVGKTSDVQSSGNRNLFEKVWTSSTEDNNLALYGFRRFKTTQLLNLRLLEEEIGRIDYQIYQSGLRLNIDPTPADRLGLKTCRKDEDAQHPDDILDEQLILKLRDLLRQYDDGLAAFNRIMAMETCSMIDDQRRHPLRTGISLREVYETRLVRVDLPPRTLQDPFQRCLHKCLHWFRYRSLSGAVLTNHDGEKGEPPTYCERATYTWNFRNTVALADSIWRILVALVANVFIVVR